MLLTVDGMLMLVILYASLNPHFPIAVTTFSPNALGIAIGPSSYVKLPDQEYPLPFAAGTYPPTDASLGDASEYVYTQFK